MKGYPRRFQKGLYVVLGVLLVSGLLLAPTFADLYLQMDVPWRASSAQRPWIALCHTGAGFVTLMFFGALWTVHMRAGIRRRRHLLSGLSLTLVTALLALTSLGIFYAGDEDLSFWSSSSHLLLGLVALPGFAAHRLSAWLGARAKTSARHTAPAAPSHNASY